MITTDFSGRSPVFAVEQLRNAVLLTIAIHTIDDGGLITIRPRAFRKVPTELSLSAVHSLREDRFVENVAGILAADERSGGYRGSGYKLTFPQGRDRALSLRLVYGTDALRPKRLRRQAVAASAALVEATLAAVDGADGPDGLTSRQIAAALQLPDRWRDFAGAALSILVRRCLAVRRKPRGRDGAFVGATYSAGG